MAKLPATGTPREGYAFKKLIQEVKLISVLSNKIEEGDMVEGNCKT
jgi:hypothetical protein